MFKFVARVTIFIGCLLWAEGRVVSIQKCCPENEVIDVHLMKCRNSGSKKWSPVYHQDTENEHEEDDELSEIEGYEIKSRIPKCPSTGVHIIPLRDLEKQSIFAAKFRLLKSGNIVAKHTNGHWITVPAESCIDGIQNVDDSGDKFSGSATDQALLTCPVEAGET